MSRESLTILPTQAANESATGLLQRKCDCGNNASALSGECEECQARSALGLQARLAIGGSDDPLEHEADRVAAQVLGMKSVNPRLAPSGPVLTRRSSGGQAGSRDAVPVSVNRILQTSGEPIPVALRDHFEPRFGRDFSQVCVHREADAAESARAVKAQAYTVGNHIVFGGGKYAPESNSGRELLAHELAHVVQQGASKALAPAGGSPRAGSNRRTPPGSDIGLPPPVSIRRRSQLQLQRRSIFEGIAGLFRGDNFSDAELRTYLELIDSTGVIEDYTESDNKARAIVSRWSRGDSLFLLTPARKVLLIREMLSGFAGDADEQAILQLLQGTGGSEFDEIIAQIGVDSLNRAFHGAEQDQLDALLALRRSGTARRGSGAQTTESEVFTPETITELQQRFTSNAESTNRRNCIEIIRDIAPLLFASDPELAERVRNRLAQLRGRTLAMTELGAAMAELGLSSEYREIQFNNGNGQRQPTAMNSSAWETIMEMVGNRHGWHIFGMAVFDGYHSVTMLVDNRPDGPRVYWADQWRIDPGDDFHEEQGSVSGFRRYQQAGFDRFLNEFTEKRWRNVFEDRCSRYRATLHIWKFRSGLETPAGASRSDENAPGLQQKLAIGSTNDPLEHEADQVAARVAGMRGQDGGSSNNIASAISLREREVSNAVGQAPEQVNDTLRAAGEPLPARTREFFEPRFGHDFGSVRIHRNGLAAASARAVSAQAYTVGNQIVFASGQYQPETAAGKSLLAHELTHTIQQGGGVSQSHTLARRGGTVGGFFNDIGRGIADFFTGSEPDYDDQVLLDYLQIIDRAGDIEDDFDSDNKVRAVVDRWRRGTPAGVPNRDFTLTVRIKSLLIREMLSGFVGDSDENAILYLLQGSPDTELATIFSEVDIERLNDSFQGTQQDQLDDLVAAYERRRAGRTITAEATDARLANVEGTGIDSALAQYLSFIDVRDHIRRAPDSHRHAREIIDRWASGDERFFLPLRRKQLLVRELLSGQSSAEDQDSVMILMRANDDVDTRLLNFEPVEAWIRTRLDQAHQQQFNQIVQAAQARQSASDALRTANDWIERIVVDQEIPQTVTVHWHSGATESDICSTGKGHCCVDANDAQGAACSAAESAQSGSNCTPVGSHKVAHTLPNSANLPDFWTEFFNSRDIALHEYSRVDGNPLSHGCVRLHQSMAQTIHGAVRPQRTDVIVQGLARPRCNWPALQAEWSGDLATAASEVDDGDPVSIQVRRRRSINRQRSTTREIYDIDNEQLDEMLERYEGETGGLQSANRLVNAQDRPAAFRSITTIADEIPRCVATQTVEERRLQTHSEPAAILQASSFGRFAPALQLDLGRSNSFGRAERAIRQHGTALWQEALSRAQTSTANTPANTDDRPLYWARLQMARVLRQWTPRWHRTHPGSARRGTIDDIRRDKKRLIALFERVSRGMEDSQFSGQPGQKRILISGFDPFGLHQDVDRVNPSGAAVLALDNRTISNAAGASAQVQGVLFPVRFVDFDRGLVEQVFQPFISSPNPPDMIMTISQGGREFEVEQFAGRRRSSGSYPDNLGATSGGTLAAPVEAPGLGQGPEFTQTTLPAAAIRSSLGRSQPLPGETRVTEIRQGETRPVRSATGPATNSTAVRGAGGGYLSNEIFYRTSLLRDRAGASIPLGHLHTPALAPPSGTTQFDQNRDAIVAGVENILKATIDEI